MKRTFLAIVAAMIIAVSASAQRLTEVTAEARLITDKMVLELGLNNIQRNKQLKKLITSKQWKLYKDAYYFYRPISWRNSAYVHNIYAKYPKANYRPNGPRPQYDNRNAFKNDKRNKPSFGKGKREFSNNSPEAIRMRQEMRRGAMKGAR